VPESVVELARSLPTGIGCWVGGAGAQAARPLLAAAGVLVFEDFDAFERALLALAA
jgi:hypothetical protein